MKGAEVIAASIRGDLVKCRKRISDMCEEMDMSPTTWGRRMQDPTTFTVGELMILLPYISNNTFHLIMPIGSRKLDTKGEL